MEVRLELRGVDRGRPLRVAARVGDREHLDLAKLERPEVEERAADEVLGLPAQRRVEEIAEALEDHARAAAKRCARTMKIKTVRLRDPWASRKLAICVRDLKALPRPAQQLFEHLRRFAQY